ncbi:PREDICTED: heat shock transcription factor, Y-linked-like [Galeopterus variegatus]|uniref:Heat shock transcription factor, Y-linked-like n=1 Tax=Galeopterus variegatus TaxID=482537 RepID=A0ABM0SE97_GALVR|nr:PREDICTED: heat shock transcription factor, Y-linked-like [Galeopterus variegatus]
MQSMLCDHDGTKLEKAITKRRRRRIRRPLQPGRLRRRRENTKPAARCELFSDDSKMLQCYRNPNFKRGFPQLLVRMKRRIRVKNASPVSAPLVQDFNKKDFRAEGNVDNSIAGLVAKTSGESLLSNSTNLNMPLTRKPSTSRRVANTTDSINSIAKRTITDQHASLNQLTTFHMSSESSYTQANGHIVNYVTSTTSASPFHIISPLQNSYFQLMVELSTFPTRCPDVSANGAPFSNLLPACNP